MEQNETEIQDYYADSLRNPLRYTDTAIVINHLLVFIDNEN